MNNKLILEQLDKKLFLISNLKDFQAPLNGWVNSFRIALNMSLGQLGNKMGMTASAVKQLEKREQSGSVSLNVLRRFAESLNMKFFYGFIPKSGMLSDMVQQRAIKIAKEIVLRTLTSMQLEDQGLTEERLKKAIQEKTDEIIRKMPRYLWD